MHCFIFLQLALTMANEILFGINITFAVFYDTDWSGRNAIIHITRSLGVLTFILSQWVFVYQYMKVAILMPFILNADDANEDARKQEEQA